MVLELPFTAALTPSIRVECGLWYGQTDGGSFCHIYLLGIPSIADCPKGPSRNIIVCFSAKLGDNGMASISPLITDS